MHILITGHTGFKGAWLTLALVELGHQVSGLSLDPVRGSLWDRADLSRLLQHDFRNDVRCSNDVKEIFGKVRPDAVMHLAAQPLVRSSYEHPRETVETNVIGTLNVLESAWGCETVKASVIVTTDKVYRNSGAPEGYRESDPLGGHDPYSASKAMADLLTQCYITSFRGPPTAIARAGNVIAGGDVSSERLLPDLVRAFRSGESAVLRFPDAVRPWQHVLDCLNGYVLLLNGLLDGTASGHAWNFGPDPGSSISVREIAAQAASVWGPDAGWQVGESDHLHEASLLTLDSSLARSSLGWIDYLTVEDAVRWTVEWEKQVDDGADAREVCLRQIREFSALRC